VTVIQMREIDRSAQIESKLVLRKGRSCKIRFVTEKR
jgi:hypothetical protein